MTITLRAGSTVMFTGDSITDSSLGFGYPRWIEGEWGFRHPDRPVTWLTSGVAGNKVMDLEARWATDVLDTRPDVVSILVGGNDMGWHTYDPDGYVISPEAFAAGYDRLLAADGMFAQLAATTAPEHWAADGVHPTPAGHAALAAAWLRLVA
ncbi:GDSL-type esterase/lipase family protein [Actinoplanes sp. NPDC051343]|uniref:GDSL-type esterase/lipase family protein n=1 Tax=Actinoplanes sp. NPDC051343 TaxID=3363906 RepID=UPI0037B2AB7C